MNTKQSVALASASALAAGIAEGAVVYSGPLNLQQNWDTVNYRQPVDMNADGISDFTFGYEANVTKPYVDVRPGLTTPNQSGMVQLLGKANRGFPVTAAGTMIDPSYAALYPVISDNRGYMFHDDQDALAGDWSNTAVTDGYVGIELSLGGGTSFGWLHFIDDPTANPANLKLVDWAYESTPGVGLQAGLVPEPSACALTGLGLAALLISRKRK